jgi:hypothetical protein
MSPPEIRVISEPVTGEMIDMVHLFAEDRRLRDWFAIVEAQPAPARAAAFEQMVRKMTAAGEDDRLIVAVSTLSSPQMFPLVRERVHQLREKERFTFPKVRTLFLLGLSLGLAALGVYWLRASLSHESDALYDRFWPALLCFFVAASILIYSLVHAASSIHATNKLLP